MAGTYSGTLTLDSSDVLSDGNSIYTIALILNSASDWAVADRAEVTPNSNVSYSFVFYPDEELVTDIIVEGIDDVTDSVEYYYLYPGYAAQLNVSTQPQGKAVAFASSNESVVTPHSTISTLPFGVRQRAAGCTVLTSGCFF